MKKVLIISFCFPPYAESGVYRVMRFAKFLSHYGWQPVILTIKEAYCIYYKTDYELVKEINKHVKKVYRTSMIRHSTQIDIPFIRKIKSLLSAKKAGTDKAEADIASSFNQRESLSDRNGIIDKIQELTSIPDEAIGWLPFAALAGLRIIKKERIDAIYTTGSPWTTHLIGYLVKRLSGKPWVVDFRDPWTQDPWKREERSLKERLSILMENKVVERADRVMTTTEALTRDFIDRFSQLDKDKFVTISNGFDPDDFEWLKQAPKKETEWFTITHTGYLYRQRSPITFLKAINQLITKGLIKKESIRVNLVGVVESSFQIEAKLKELNLQGIVNLTGHTPHQESLQYLFDADILLLIQPATKIQVPAKIYEYIRLGKPILCLSPSEGVTTELIIKEGLGYVVEPDDIESIAQAIYTLYLQFKQGEIGIPGYSKIQERYNGLRLTGQLAGMLDELSEIYAISAIRE